MANPTRHQPFAVRNGLLAALPPGDLARLRPMLRPVELPFTIPSPPAGGAVDAVLFVESGMVSMVAALEDGQLMEVGIVGREGMVGLPVVLGADSGSVEAMVQVPGAALGLPAAVLVEALGRGPALKALLLRYVQAFHVQVAQTAACNGCHPVEERLARWLLMTHDRAGGDVFPMTQEFIATMLGVRRAGVSVTAGILQRAGVITYARGRRRPRPAGPRGRLLRVLRRRAARVRAPARLRPPGAVRLIFPQLSAAAPFGTIQTPAPRRV